MLCQATWTCFFIIFLQKTSLTRVKLRCKLKNSKALNKYKFMDKMWSTSNTKLDSWLPRVGFVLHLAFVELAEHVPSHRWRCQRSPRMQFGIIERQARKPTGNWFPSSDCTGPNSCCFSFFCFFFSLLLLLVFSCSYFLLWPVTGFWWDFNLRLMLASWL